MRGGAGSGMIDAGGSCGVRSWASMDKVSTCAGSFTGTSLARGRAEIRWFIELDHMTMNACLH